MTYCHDNDSANAMSAEEAPGFRETGQFMGGTILPILSPFFISPRVSRIVLPMSHGVNDSPFIRGSLADRERTEEMAREQDEEVSSS